MSVFTPLTRAELETFLAPYGLGRLRDFQGIAAGTENSNFFISLKHVSFALEKSSCIRHTSRGHTAWENAYMT